MRKIHCLSLLLFFVFLACAAAQAALGDVYSLNGGIYRNDKPVQETLQFGDVKSILQRTSMYIPASYGKLIGMTPNADHTIFWFEDDNGVIRNVVLSSEELALIERKGSGSITRP